MPPVDENPAMTSRPEKGELAPKLHLPATPDGEVTLGAAKGAGQVLFFYPKDNTPGCATEARDFSAQKSAFDALGLEIIGISRDSLRSHTSFAAKQNLTVTLASDEDGTACQAYGTWVLKQNYGREYLGIERTTFLIDHTGKILEIWRKVRVKGHVDSVLDRARDLFGGGA